MIQQTESRYGHVASVSMATLVGVLLVLAANSPPAFAQMTPPASDARTYALYIGTYTQGWACAAQRDCTSAGIYRAEFNAATGTLSAPVLVAKTVNPSYVAVHPSGRFAYAVSEVGDYMGQATGAISAYRIGAGGQLTEIGMLSSFGGDPCYVSVDAAGRNLFVANYGGGSIASYHIGTDGTLTVASSIPLTGSGPHPNQKGPHGHYIAESPAKGRVYVADLGSDQVRVYRVDAATGTLTLDAVPPGHLPPGSGPRHIAFHPSNRYAYVNNELASTVTVFAHDAATGALSPVQTLRTVPAGFTGENNTAEIQASADGRFVYVANRGHNSIAVFQVNATSGTLTLLDVTPSLGDWPRDFKLDPTGGFLLVEHQKSDNIVVFRIDRATGRLTPTGHELRVSKPVSIAFMPVSARTLMHVVTFKFKASATQPQIDSVVAAFTALKTKIPTIHEFSWGTNVSPEKLNKGFTHAFVLSFGSDADRDAYLVHPDHAAFGKLLSPILDDVFVIDYWTQDFR
jgi:6-phosphogluconolactonase